MPPPKKAKIAAVVELDSKILCRKCCDELRRACEHRRVLWDLCCCFPKDRDMSKLTKDELLELLATYNIFDSNNTLFRGFSPVHYFRRCVPFLIEHTQGQYLLEDLEKKVQRHKKAIKKCFEDFDKRERYHQQKGDVSMFITIPYDPQDCEITRRWLKSLGIRIQKLGEEDEITSDDLIDD